jgi:spore maturation protein CgeB
MAEMGYCPSGRLFEAAACGVPVLTDLWEGLEQFFEPGREIITARSAEDAIAAVELSKHELTKIGSSARERVLAQHTAAHRAAELESALESATRVPPLALPSQLEPGAGGARMEM